MTLREKPGRLRSTTAAALLSVGLIGCKTAEPSQPSLGMTKEEIRNMYGGPKTIMNSEVGEVWMYDNFGKSLIPYNFGWQPRTKQFFFDKTGHLQHFRIDQ